MKSTLIWASVVVFVCLLSGFAGAYSMTLLRRGPIEGQTLQVRRLELVDSNRRVRSVFTAEDNGSVALRMLSKQGVSVVELGVDEDRGGTLDKYTPAGSLTIRDGDSIPIIRLRGLNKGKGTLSFSTTRTEGQVEVGYMPYGDTVGGRDLAIWGIAVRNAHHEYTGVGVRTQDDIAQEFVGPRKSDTHR